MRQAITALIALCLTTAGGFAQTKPDAPTLVEANSFDNFYIGVNGGLSVMPFYTKPHKHLNPTVGLRLGRDLTPVFGVIAESNLYFDDRPWNTIATTVKYVNVGAMATANLSNWIGGYGERPRLFEVEAEMGFGWGHAFGHSGAAHSRQNDLTCKTGFAVSWNPGWARSWKVYLEPAMTWNILDGAAREDGIQFNFKKSFVQLSIGACYRLPTSNGTHHFKRGGMSSGERYLLQSQLKELFSELDSTIQVLGDAQYTVNQQEKTIDHLQHINDSTTSEMEAIRKQTAILPVCIVFKTGSSEVDAAQQPNLQLIADYLRQHPSVILQVRGYATPDADISDFRRLAEARAGSVKYLLVKRFNIDASRLIAVGGGITNELFDQTELNRIVTFKRIENRE